MYKVLFDLKKQYYFNSLFPLYKEMMKDNNYDIYFRVGKDQKRFLGIFLISQKNEIKAELQNKGYKITEKRDDFDLVVCGDAVRNPNKYGKAKFFHLDHGVGIKTLRIRNIKRQEHQHYHVFLEGQYWYDYIKSLGWEDVAHFYITGLPKLDPLFWPNYYNDESLIDRLGLDRNKNTVLFAPSYKPSCIKFIKDKLTDLIPIYNLVIKLHPYSWAGKYAPHSQHRFYQRLSEKENNVYLIPKKEYDIYPYLSLADTLISDTSSVINEFLALGKYGIIYVLPHEKLKHSDGMPILSIDPEEWLKGAFPHMHKPDDLIPAVELALNPNQQMKSKLNQYRNYFFTGLDGNSSVRVKKKIDNIMKESKK